MHHAVLHQNLQQSERRPAAQGGAPLAFAPGTVSPPVPGRFELIFEGACS